MKRFIVVILSIAFTAFAFWPAGGVKVVQTPDVIENPQMAYIEDGSVIISWEADRLIYCQKLDTTGVIHWDAEGVRVCLSDSNQRDHHMVTDGQDVWFVWQDERSDDGDIYAQKIDGSTGQRLWGEQGKAVCVKAGLQRRQGSTVLNDGSFIASWEDENVDPRNIAAQWFNTNGQILWETNGIYVNKETDRAYTPFVGPSGEEVVFVWRGAEEGDTIGANFSQRVDSTSNFLWDTLGVLIEYSSTPYGICSDGLGGAVVLFSNPGYLGVQRIDSTGQVVWDSGGVKITEFVQHNLQSKSIPYPDPDWNGIISDAMGGCFVWSGFDVHHVDSIGNLIWGSTGVLYWEDDGLTYRLAGTSLCPDGNKGLMMAFDNLEWTSAEWPPYVDQGVRIQRVNADGELVFDTNGLIVRLWNPDSLPYGEFKTGATAVPSGVIVSWSDNRHQPDYSLYAQIVDTTGKIGSGVEEESLEPFSYPLLAVSSNVSSGIVAVKYSLPVNQSGVLKLFEVTGRLLKSQILTQREGVITLNTLDLPSGVYYVQLSTSTYKSTSRKVLVIH